MKTQADSIQEDKSQSSSHGKFQSQGGGESTFQFVDNRSEAIVQRKLQELANNSPHAKKIAQFQAMADNQSAQQQPIQKKENNTGLPNNLKTGVENLSGISLDDVKVHRNSDKPAQLQAHAYAQGTDIHLGAGQEKHLPHEAWHVVQQKQGRVKPTLQMKGGVLVNDEMGLEKEADVMGAKAVQLKARTEYIKVSNSKGISDNIVQRSWEKNPESDIHLWDKARDGLAWFYEKDLMKFQIVDEEEPTEEWLAFYKYYEGQSKSYEDWNTLFKPSKPEKKVDVNAARDAALHTVGAYQARNAVIATLTKYNLLETCTAKDWSAYRLPNYKDILSNFKENYFNIVKKSLLSDVVEEQWNNYFDQALPIIKGFQKLGTGDEKLEGTFVNRGDSEGILKAMGLFDDLNELTDGTTTSFTSETKFIGVTSTAKGNKPGNNQYATKSTVVWILKIAKEHHGFDFMELVGEGYVGETEITFPMGVMVKVNSVITHRKEEHAALRPSGCGKAKYTIYGDIF